MDDVTPNRLLKDDALRQLTFDAIKQDHDRMIELLKKTYLHKEVTLINTYPKKSRGRAAYIEGIIIDRGEPLFLCMVLHSGSETEFLNSEGGREHIVRGRNSLSWTMRVSSHENV